MGRALRPDERAMLAAMVERADPFPDERPVPVGRRREWGRLLASTSAGRTCACGACPSIELEDERGPVPDGECRIVLSASIEHADLLLFIDRDRPSYLELAPHDDRVLDRFPPVEAVRF